LGGWFSGLADITKTSTSDPSLLIGCPMLLGALAIAACYIPARRSIRIDPAIALREE